MDFYGWNRLAAIALAFACALTAPPWLGGGRCGHAMDGGMSLGKSTVPCVLLNNGNVVFGRARQMGPNVVIDGSGGQLSIRYQEVACWANSIQELYRYRVDHRAGDHEAAALRDAKWCLRYGLVDEAIVELQGLAKRNPELMEVKVLLEQTIKAKATHPSSQAETSRVQRVRFDQRFESQQNISQTVALTKEEPVSGTSTLSVNGETLAEFTKRIQPTLINRCGRCHSTRTESSFRLTIPAGHRRPSATMTQRNLEAVGAHASDNQHGIPKLLWYATHAHGSLQVSPLTKRDADAEENLRAWFMAATSQTPMTSESMHEAKTGGFEQTQQMRGQQGPGQQGPGNLRQVQQEQSNQDQAHQAAWDALFSESEDPVETSRSTSHRLSTEAPSRLPRVEDPFDPERFNRLYHR